jgi:hypothetical protein
MPIGINPGKIPVDETPIDEQMRAFLNEVALHGRADGTYDPLILGHLKVTVRVTLRTRLRRTTGT